MPHDRLLSLSNTQYQSSTTVFGEGPQSYEEIGEAACNHTDKAASYGIAIKELKKEGKYPEETEYRQVE